MNANLTGGNSIPKESIINLRNSSDNIPFEAEIVRDTPSMKSIYLLSLSTFHHLGKLQNMQSNSRAKYKNHHLRGRLLHLLLLKRSPRYMVLTASFRRSIYMHYLHSAGH